MKSQIALLLTIFTFYLVFCHLPATPNSFAAVDLLQPSNQFSLKHIYHHNIGKKHKIHKRWDVKLSILDNHDPDPVYPSFTSVLSAKSRPNIIKRLVDRHPDFIEDYFRSLDFNKHEINLEWRDDIIQIPEITDRGTIISLAQMSSMAYKKVPEDAGWVDVAAQYNQTVDVGWDDDGIRGHVFVNGDNSTIIIGIKGTSANAFYSDNTETSSNDKINDNLLFSCCCARISYLWSTVCDCFEKSYTCNQDCLEKELYREDRYYQALLDLYRNVTTLYPDTENIWVTGHSLGGSLASLLGRTFGLPVVTFEAVPELLPTKRLHLPMPPGLSSNYENIWHFGHTADPVFMGTCNGITSSCWSAGYAFETQCFSGKTCVFDTVTDLGWYVLITHHRIDSVINDVLLTYNGTAKCTDPPPCYDCYDWTFSSKKT